MFAASSQMHWLHLELCRSFLETAAGVTSGEMSCESAVNCLTKIEELDHTPVQNDTPLPSCAAHPFCLGRNIM